MKSEILCGDNVKIIQNMEKESVDLVVTSPPYDSMRSYKNGNIFDFEKLICLLLDVMKEGGIVVWITNDQTIDGSETGTSFKQALRFRDVGFNLYDSMIWDKGFGRFPSHRRYTDSFEYMFIFSKGTPKTANIIQDRKNKHFGTMLHGTTRCGRGRDDEMETKKIIKKPIKEYGRRYNI